MKTWTSWSGIVCGRLLQWGNVVARLWSDSLSAILRSQYSVSMSWFSFMGSLPENPKPLTKITTIIQMDVQWRIHYFIWLLREMAVKAFLNHKKANPSKVGICFILTHSIGVTGKKQYLLTVFSWWFMPQIFWNSTVFLNMIWSSQTEVIQIRP